MPRENHGVTVGAMQVLARAVTPEDKAANPSLALETTKLQAYVDEIQKLVLERDALEARKQETTSRIKEILVEGSRQHTLVEAILKCQHGPGSEKLVAYRIQPFRGRKRRPAEEVPEAETVAVDIPAHGAP